MKYLIWILFAGGVFLIINGAVGFYFRFNFVTQTTYGPSLMPIYIAGVGVALAMTGLALSAVRGGDQ